MLALPATFVLAIEGPATGPYIGMVVLGFLVGIFGHLAKSNTLVAIGIGLIVVALVVFQFDVRNTVGS